MPKSPSRKTADLQIAIAEGSQGSGLGDSPTRKARAKAGRIMYIECKAGGLTGEARIGRVTFSQTGRTLYYRGQTFQSLKGARFKSNYYCVETGEDYWISGPARSAGAATLCTSATYGLQLMKMFARSIGETSDDSQREPMKRSPDLITGAECRGLTNSAACGTGTSQVMATKEKNSWL